MVITPNHNILNNIAIAITINSLYNNFNSTTNIILKYDNKTINKIQQILVSIKAKFIGKRITSITRDFVMIFKNCIKRKITSKNKCFNYKKLSYFGKNCIISTIHKKIKSDK